MKSLLEKKNHFFKENVERLNGAALKLNCLVFWVLCVCTFRSLRTMSSCEFFKEFKPRKSKPLADGDLLYENEKSQSQLNLS